MAAAEATKSELKKRLSRARGLMEEGSFGEAVRELRQFHELLVWHDPHDPDVQAMAEVGRDLAAEMREKMAALRGRSWVLGDDSRMRKAFHCGMDLELDLSEMERNL